MSTQRQSETFTEIENDFDRSLGKNPEVRVLLKACFEATLSEVGFDPTRGLVQLGSPYLVAGNIHSLAYWYSVARLTETRRFERMAWGRVLSCALLIDGEMPRGESK